MRMKPETKLAEEMEKVSKEVKIMKRYLSTLIKLNLEQIKEVEPTDFEKKILKKPIRKSEFLDWDEIKDEI